ncbi:MAG: hypothetical protein AAF597_06710 [Bacteroidota bacterium]
MPKKDRRKKKKLLQPESGVPAAPESSRFRFFVWICCFFFVAALLLRLDVITAWPGAEGFSLDHALSNNRGDTMLSFLYGRFFSWGEAIDPDTQAVWLFPRILSVTAVLGTAYFTYRWAGRLFGSASVRFGLLAAGASFFLPFFGKVATPDALGLLGQAGFFWLVLLSGADKEKQYLLPAGIFLLLGAIAAPLSTLVFGLATILSARLLMGGSKQWMNLLFLLAIPLMVLLLQGIQGNRSYWFWGNHPFAYGKFLAYCFLGSLPVSGWLAGGLRDLVYKIRKQELRSQLLGAGLAIGLVTQSLVFPLILALLAGKQMQVYFREEHYPWRDWVRGFAVVHLVFAFIGAVVLLLGLTVTFPGGGFRAALGAVAAYWMFSLLGVIGLYGNRRDFSIGGTVLAGMLGVLFFWVQVYPYVELGRNWPERMVRQVEVPLPTYIPQTDEFSPALPYFRQAGIPVTTDSTAADLYLRSWPTTDTVSTAGIEIEGREVMWSRVYGLGTR